MKKKQGKYIDGLVQVRSNSSVLVMELLQSCTTPLICLFIKFGYGYILVSTWTFLSLFQ